MVQTAFPAEDILNQGWQDRYDATIDGYPPIGDTDAIYAAIETQTDDDFILSPHEPSDIVYVTKLSELVHPGDLAGDWTIKFRAAKPTVIATRLDLTVQLRQFYVDESDAATIGELIAETTIEDISNTLTDYEFVVPDTSFVTSSMDLYLRVIADTVP